MLDNHPKEMKAMELFRKGQREEATRLQDEFLAEVKDLPQRNLAVELLQKLLKGEIRSRSKRNVVQARSFSAMLEEAIQNLKTGMTESADDDRWSPQITIGMPVLIPEGRHFGIERAILLPDKTFLRSRRYSPWNAFHN